MVCTQSLTAIRSEPSGATSSPADFGPQHPAKAGRCQIRREPFPHLVIEDRLPASDYQQLAAAYPEDGLICELAGSRRKGAVRQNQRNDIGAHQARLNQDRANTLVLFVNSEQSLHAVSSRSVTPHTRRLVNFVAEVYRPVPDGLFVKRQRPLVALRNALRKPVRKLGRLLMRKRAGA